jgi:iron complex outermembrane receptor protein
MRTFRAPAVEELFSEGPHLAAYSYEVGNAELPEETGIGVEAVAEHEFDAGSVRLVGFVNDLATYIFPRNTGQRSLRRADLLLYQFDGQHARMVGFEVGGMYRLTSWLTTTGQIQHVRGTLVETGHDLPRIPPIAATIELKGEWGPLSVTVDARGAGRQTKAGEFESPTAGYVIADVAAQLVVNEWGLLHSFSLTVENLSDKEYRRHLNRVKQIMPEPGRSVRLLYKLFY